MAVSNEHEKLVQEILNWSRETYDCSLLSISYQCSLLHGSSPTPPINGFYPDVHITDLKNTFLLIGEAKTKGDLEQNHSKAQILGYLKYIDNFVQNHTDATCILVLATQWAMAGRAKGLLRGMIKREKLSLAKYHVLDQLSVI